MSDDFFGRHEEKLNNLEKKTDRMNGKIDKILDMLIDVKEDVAANKIKIVIYASATALIVTGLVTSALRVL